jgi:hypothetical protein
LDEHAFVVEGHRPAHGTRRNRHIGERENGGAVTGDIEQGGRGGRELFSFRLLGRGSCLGMAAGKSGVAEGGAEPVGGYVGVRAGVLFGADVVEGGDGERVDGRWGEQRIAAALDGEEADAALFSSGDGGGEGGSVAGSVAGEEAEKDVAGQSRAEDLLVGPMALVEVEIVLSGLLGDGAFGIGGLEASALSHLLEGAELDRMRAVGIGTVRKLRLRRRGYGNGSFLGRNGVDRGLLDRLAARRGAEGGQQGCGQQDRLGWGSVHGDPSVPAGYMSPGRMSPGPIGGCGDLTPELEDSRNYERAACERLPFAIPVSSRLEQTRRSL